MLLLLRTRPSLKGRENRADSQVSGSLGEVPPQLQIAPPLWQETSDRNISACPPLSVRSYPGRMSDRELHPLRAEVPAGGQAPYTGYKSAPRTLALRMPPSPLSETSCKQQRAPGLRSQQLSAVRRQPPGRREALREG